MTTTVRCGAPRYGAVRPSVDPVNLGGPCFVMDDVSVATNRDFTAPVRRLHPRLVAALVVVVSIGAVLIVRDDNPRRHLTVTPPPNESTLDTTPPTAVTEPQTTAATEPATTEPATTAVEAPSAVSAGGSVSDVSPPPALPLRSLGSTELAPRDGGEPSIDAAIGDSGIVVNQSWAGYLTEIGFDGAQRNVPIDGELGPIVYGPGEVAYGLRQGQAVDAFAMVAVALDGARSGTTVASTPIGSSAYAELPAAPFGHGRDGIVDRVRDINATLVSYVDTQGAPLTWTGPDPVLLTSSRSSPAAAPSISDSLGHMWQLSVDASPDAPSPFIENAQPAPTANGDAVYWTFIGPDARTDQDFGLETMPVVAVLHPEGSVTWWSVPAGWTIVASDVWGTVLARLNGLLLDLALADFWGQGGQAPAPTACLGGMRADDAAHVFTAAMIDAREAGRSLDSLSDCLTVVPDVFSGTAPACWSACDDTTRTFAPDALTSGDVVMPDGTRHLGVSLPVTYKTPTGYLDVLESWQMTPTETGYAISGFAIDSPPFTRQRALETVTAYFSSLAARDWLAAATLLYGGALEPESRGDLHELQPDDYTLEGIAAALARWCASGCNTTLPTIDDLEFSGSFGLTRAGHEIRVAWYEGSYSIVGVPFRS